MEERNNHSLNAVIEQFINAYNGTAIGDAVRNMYENGTSYEAICDYLGLNYDDYI